MVPKRLSTLGCCSDLNETLIIITDYSCKCMSLPVYTELIFKKFLVTGDWNFFNGNDGPPPYHYVYTSICPLADLLNHVNIVDFYH